MSLWGKRDNYQLTGTVSANSGDTTLVGTNTAFDTEIVAGSAITVDDEKYKVLVVTNSTSISIEPGAANTITDANCFGQELPKHLNRFEIDRVYFVDSDEAEVANNKAKGLGTPGWYEYRTYTDSANNTRHKAVLLVELSSANSTVAGDAADDAVVED